VVPKKLHLKRIDAAMSALEPELSRSHCGALVTDGMVSIISEAQDNDSNSDNKDSETVIIVRKSHKVEAGTTLVIRHPPEERPTELVPQKLPLDILFEDEHMIVLNKAAGMVVHPAAGNWDGTVVNALAYYLMHESPFGRGEFIEEDGTVADVDDGTDGEQVSFRPGIVHRLDKGTTGILVVAKTRQALSALSEAFAARTVKKTYVALTIGNPGKRVVIDKPIGRHPIHRQRMRVVPDPHQKDSSRMTPDDRRMLKSISAKSASQAGRRALSFVDTMAFDGKLSVVQVRIETGRTHQIRVHLQDRHTPIYGDEVYGLSDWNKRLSKTRGVARPLLHAHRLELVHPILAGQKMVFLAPMAKDMAETADTIWPEGREERPDLFYGHGKQQQVDTNKPQQ
jgi:23S rRNA pseudouridine1911/1915/1917 synthase